LTAVREEKVAFIPSKSGYYTLPALEISWFNTKTKSIEKASLPSVTIKALAGQGVVPEQPAAPAPANHDQTDVQVSAPLAVNENANIRIWQGLSAVLAIGWLVTLFILFRKPRPAPAPLVASVAKPTAMAEIEKSLKRACWENRANTARQLLLEWGKARYQADSLGAIARHCGSPLREEIEILNQYLYSGQQQAWSGEPLWQAFSHYTEAQAVKPDEQDGLEPLYKL
jgi:hypothetical protein